MSTNQQSSAANDWGNKILSRNSEEVYSNAQFGDCDSLRRLIDSGASVNLPIECGATPICTAAAQGRTNALSLLIKSGGDPNTSLENGISPIFLACWKATGQSGLNCVRKLIEAGVNVDKPLIYNNTTPLHAAAISGNSKSVRELLKAGADVRFLFFLSIFFFVRNVIPNNKNFVMFFHNTCSLTKSWGF